LLRRCDQSFDLFRSEILARAPLPIWHSSRRHCPIYSGRVRSCFRQTSKLFHIFRISHYPIKGHLWDNKQHTTTHGRHCPFHKSPPALHALPSLSLSSVQKSRSCIEHNLTHVTITPSQIEPITDRVVRQFIAARTPTPL